MKNIHIIDIFGVINDNEKELYASRYIPLISFHSQEQKEIAKSYIFEEGKDFFKNILNIDTPQYILYSKTINWQDFSEVEIKYFYKMLFPDLCERDSTSGKLINKLKWGVTFDAELAPIQPTFMNEEGNLSYLDERQGRPSLHYNHLNRAPLYRRYGVITLNGEAVFYYLYFTLQEILDAIKRKRTEI